MDAAGEKRVERLEEQLMFEQRQQERLRSDVEELSRQVAGLHGLVERLEKRLKDVERRPGGGEDVPLPEDEVPPHNAF